MTAIKPIESLRVRGVPATKYPTNKVCAMPDCTKPAEGTHHCFPRSLIGNDSYFVTILDEDGNECSPFPHAVGLCGSGTTGHHGDVEEHRAWIKLEDDGTFVWHDRLKGEPEEGNPSRFGLRPGDLLVSGEEASGMWRAVGPLNPQPGSREGKPKRKRTVKGTTERAERKTVSVRLPEGFNGEDWDDLIESVDTALKRLEDSPLDPNRAEPVVGVCVVYGLQAFLGLGG